MNTLRIATIGYGDDKEMWEKFREEIVDSISDRNGKKFVLEFVSILNRDEWVGENLQRGSAEEEYDGFLLFPTKSRHYEEMMWSVDAADQTEIAFVIVAWEKGVYMVEEWDPELKAIHASFRTPEKINMALRKIVERQRQ